MQNINSYIVEKLHLDKDIYTHDDNDAREFEVNDIIYTNPNIEVEGNPSKPGIPVFYKVISNNKKKLEICMLGSELISGSTKNGEKIPNEKEYGKCKLTIGKNGITEYGSNILFKWDGNPVKFYNN